LQHLAREVQALGDQATGEISGTVRLVANMSSMIGFLPERLKAFSTACPRVAVSLAECDTRDVLRACLDDRADAGVGVRTDVPPGLEAWHVANDPLMVVMPRGHALARQRTLRYAEVLAWPLIGIHPGGAMDTELRERADAAHLPRMSPVSVSSFDTACRMVEVGLGIAIIPASAVTAYAGTGKFVRRPLAEPWAARELWLYALRKTPRLRPVQALIEALRGQAPRA
jgi:DNA-binding transcriptional LysR family regulator